MKVGDLVKIRSNKNNDVTFCIIDFKADLNGECMAVLKAIYNENMIVEAPIDDLENILSKGKL